MRLRRRVIARRRILPRRVRHHPAVRVTAVVVVVLVATSFLQRVASAAVQARRDWGASREVIVARHRIAIGTVIDRDAIETATWPLAVIPEGAVVMSPAGRVAIADIEPGEAVIAARLAPDGLHGVAALVPDGSRAVAIPVGPSVVALEVGDRVDLIAGFDAASADSGQSPTLTVARDALVVDVDDERVTVAVREADVPRVAFAVIAGTIVPALRST